MEEKRRWRTKIKPQWLFVCVHEGSGGCGYIYFFHSRLSFTANPHNAGRTSSNTSQVFFFVPLSVPPFLGFFSRFLERRPRRQRQPPIIGQD